MRLSEAIRLGAMLHRQAFGSYSHIDKSGRVFATCALGAARAAGYEIESGTLKLSQCPECGDYVWCPAFPLVAHLNDIHQWTRERIADWVETIELERQPANEEATATNAVAGTVD